MPTLSSSNLKTFPGSGSVKSPKVAFLMAVYDKEKPEYLRQSIESMLNQTYKNVSIHIFKDGALGEDLEQVLACYPSASFPVFFHQHPENRGLAVCLNEMITVLKDRYDYFARMDSDDVACLDRIEKQVAFLETHSEIDILGGCIIDIDERGKELKKVRYPEQHEEILKFFQKRNPIAHASVMYRNSYFRKAGLYPPVRLEDGLYWMKGFLSGCRFHNISDALIGVRRTDDFLKRRSGLQKAWQEFRIKLTINRQLKYGLNAYVYAFATFGFQLLPVSMKQILYHKLR